MNVYQFPEYYALGYRWNTEAECDFVEACLKRFGVTTPARILDLGCGAGRHLFELAKRGHRVTGFDIRPEMIAFVEQERRKRQAKVEAYVGDLRADPTRGQFDAAICFMDTFRFLLTNDEIIAHLQRVAEHLAPGGVYLTDFWISRQWDQIGNEIYQWEQSDGDTTVRVFYVQHPDSIDPVTQTFEDELVFSIDEGGATREIRGERTRTRLILPQEFAALVRAAGGLKLLGSFPDFDLKKPLTVASMTWRMISVLQRPA